MPSKLKKTGKKARKPTRQRISNVRRMPVFSQEFTNLLLVIFGVGIVLFAYVILRLYG